jgi:hypothetical protein
MSLVARSWRSNAIRARAPSRCAKNIRMYLLGSDDFPPEAKIAVAGARSTMRSPRDGAGLAIAERCPLEDIATAHEHVEAPEKAGASWWFSDT